MVFIYNEYDWAGYFHISVLMKVRWINEKMNSPHTNNQTEVKIKRFNYAWETHMRSV